MGTGVVAPGRRLTGPRGPRAHWHFAGQKGLFFEARQWPPGWSHASFCVLVVFCFWWQGLESAVTEEGHIQVAARRYPYHHSSIPMGPPVRLRKRALEQSPPREKAGRATGRTA